MDNEENDEEQEFLPGDFVSNTDQMLAQMTEIGRALAAYCRNLIEVGFPPEVAFKLSVDWHRSYWAGAHGAMAMGYDFEDEEEPPDAE